MCEFVRHDVGDVLELGLGRVFGVDEQQRLPVGDQAVFSIAPWAKSGIATKSTFLSG